MLCLIPVDTNYNSFLLKTTFSHQISPNNLLYLIEGQHQNQFLISNHKSKISQHFNLNLSKLFTFGDIFHPYKKNIYIYEFYMV